jgi:hypothetical protein
MQYGEQVVLSDAGIRLSAKQLEMIGMGPESSCWGLWLPEWSGSGETSRGATTLPQHLVLSPFKVDMWPCLLRIVLKINDSHGALSRAIACLVDCGINTLSHHFTPCGHHHATYTLIGVPFKAWAQTNVPANAMKVGEAESEKQAAHLAVRMLAEVKYLEDKLLDDNFKAWRVFRTSKAADAIDGSFLRMRYVWSQKPTLLPVDKNNVVKDPADWSPAEKKLYGEEGKRIGLAYSPLSKALIEAANSYVRQNAIHAASGKGTRKARIIGGSHGRLAGVTAQDVMDAASRYAAKAVAIDWLQYPAFFALHGLTSGAMQFRFDAANEMLRPHTADEGKYRANLRKAIPEFLNAARAIACLDNRSNFIRVQPSRARGRPYLSVSVRHEFDSTRRRRPDGCLENGEYKPGDKSRTKGVSDVKGSAGLLQHLTAAIRKAGGDVWHVKNTVGAMGTNAETSEIEFWLDEAAPNSLGGDICPEPGEEPTANQAASHSAEVTTAAASPSLPRDPDCACTDEAPLNSPLAFNDRVRQCIEEKRAVIERLGVTMSVPDIRPVRSEHIFISTKYSFWHETRKTDVRAGVEELVHRYGYTVQCTPNDQPPHEPSIVLDVQKRITTAAGVVQILSKFDGWKDCNGSSMQWLLFEAGLARGSGVPLVYAVDAKDDDEINAWKNILRTHSGEAYFLFRSDFDGKTITEKIGHAIKHLDEIIRRPRGPEVWWH